jgi:hypothetical protein
VPLLLVQLNPLVVKLAQKGKRLVRLLLVQLPSRSLLLVRLLHAWLTPRGKRLLVQFA